MPNDGENMKTRQEIAEQLYGLNRYISAYWITGKTKPNMNDFTSLNKALGEIIKELREEK